MFSIANKLGGIVLAAIVPITTTTLPVSAPQAQGPGNPAFVDVGGPSTGYYPIMPVLADLNADGKLDLTHGFLEAYLPVYLGNGDGTFGPPIKLFIGNGYKPTRVTSADLNGDGELDLVTANWAQGSGSPRPINPDISVFLGNGDGTFGPEIGYQVGLPISSNPDAVETADLNADGNPDIVAGLWSEVGSVTVQPGNGDGTFQPAAMYLVGENSSRPVVDVTVGDVNGDGKPDVVTADYQSSAVSVLLGNGDGTLQGPVKYPTFSFPYSVDLADIDHDSDLDLLVFGALVPDVAVLLGNGNGTFQPEVRYYVGHIGWQGLFTDIDGDGELDIMTANTTGGLSILLGNGNGTFQTETSFGGGIRFGLAVGDLDGDNVPDVVTANALTNSLTVFLQINTNNPPVADAGPDQAVQCTSPLGASVTLDGTGSSDPDSDPLTYQWDVPAGITLDDPASQTPTGVFPIGMTTAILTVADGRGGVDSDQVEITVADSTPPDVKCSTDLAVLWPPNHRMVAVQIFVEASDTCATPAQLMLAVAEVSSNEPDDAAGLGDGQTTGDTAHIDGYTSPVDVTTVLVFNPVSMRYEGTVPLRAERGGSGSGRSYTIVVTVMDPWLNASTARCVVVVPHERPKKN